jgi:hypothetical protein
LQVLSSGLSNINRSRKNKYNVYGTKVAGLPFHAAYLSGKTRVKRQTRFSDVFDISSQTPVPTCVLIFISLGKQRMNGSKQLGASQVARLYKLGTNER